MTVKHPITGTEGPIQWKVDLDTQVLTLSGKGPLPDYEPYEGSMPGWIRLRHLFHEVQIEEGIKHVGDYAFFPFDYGELGDYPSQLEYIHFPKSLQSIGYSAFRGNTNLKEINLRGLENLQSISSFAFASCFSAKKLSLFGCQKLTSIEIHAFAACDNVRYIDLTGCSSLSEESLIILLYDFPKYLPILGASKKLIDNIKHAEYWKRIGPTLIGQRHPEEINLFGHKPSFIYTLHDGVLHITGAGDLPAFDETAVHATAPWRSCSPIGGIAFNDLVEQVFLSEGITAIGAESFSQLPFLKRIVFPSSLTYVGEDAFRYCRNLEQLDFSQCPNLRYIGKNAFAVCPHLTDVLLPNGPLAKKRGSFCFDFDEIRIPLGNRPFFDADRKEKSRVKHRSIENKQGIRLVFGS